MIPVELVAPAEESSSRLVPEAVAESLRDTIGADQGARRIIGTLDSRVGLKAEKEDMMVVVVDEEQEEEGSHFSRLPSAASVQRYRHETLCPKTTAPPSSSLSGPASAHTVPARKREGKRPGPDRGAGAQHGAPSLPSRPGTGRSTSRQRRLDSTRGAHGRPRWGRSGVAVLRHDLAEVSHADGEVVAVGWEALPVETQLAAALSRPDNLAKAAHKENESANRPHEAHPAVAHGLEGGHAGAGVVITCPFENTCVKKVFRYLSPL